MGNKNTIRMKDFNELPIEILDSLRNNEMLLVVGGVTGINEVNNSLGLCTGVNNGDGTCTGVNNGDGTCAGVNNGHGRCTKEL